MTRYPQGPTGWRVDRRRSAGPFTTAVTYARPDGSTVEWSPEADGTVFFVGSVFFTSAAALQWLETAVYVLPSTGAVANATVANVATW